jgi:hypothetical protein
MTLLWDLGDAWSSIQCLEWLAMTQVRGHPRTVARLLASAAAWRETLALPRPPEEDERHERAVAALRDVLGADAFAAAWAAGQSLTSEQAIAEVLDVGRG